MGYLLVIFLLGLLIMIHELGHLLAARWMKIPVSRFSIGFGPKLWGFDRANIEYRLSAIPLGGYVLLGISEETDYLHISVRKRIVYALGGPAANLLGTVLFFLICNLASGHVSFYGLVIAPFVQTGDMLVRLLAAIAQLFVQPSQVSSIVGIVAMGGQYVGLDVARAAFFTAIISLNLAVLNLLPLPPLDGGKIILDLLQRLQPKLARVYPQICIVGWVLIAGLFLYATLLDLSRWIGCAASIV